MKNLGLILSLIFSVSPLYAESQAIGGKWGGLHDSDASILIEDNEAQSLQDVDITESGSGIKKRSGYAQFQTVGTSTWAVRGGYFFKDASSNDTIVHTNNRSVYKSASGGTYSAFITTDTAGSYYDFTDSQGSIWRATSNNDEIASYNGTAVTYYPNAPKGDQIEVMPDRMAISGSTTTPNTVYFSAAADFTDYTTGILENSAFTESFGLPGQKVTAIKYAFGQLMVWTKTTTSIWSGTNQYDGIIEDISKNIGTDQPNSIIEDNGLICWQAQDKHFYCYDGNTINKISRKISGSVQNFAGGSSKNATQTNQSDFSAGTLTYVSAYISNGDVVLSTFTQTDSSTADFGAGTTSNTTVQSDRIYLSTNNANLLNNSFEDGSVDNWTLSGSASQSTTFAQDGTKSIRLGRGASSSIIVTIDGVVGGGIPWSSFTLDTWTQHCFTQVDDAPAGDFTTIYLQDSSTSDGVTSDTYLSNGGQICFYFRRASGSPSYGYIDTTTGGRSSITSGTFTSQPFNTTFSSGAWLSSGANWTINGHAVSLQTQASADASSWDTAVSWTTGTAPTSAWKQYIRYVATISTGGTTNGTSLPYIDDVTFNARSGTGTFISSNINIGANITSWGNFSADQTLNNGGISYAIRTATTTAGLSSASWVTLTRDAQITASTGSYANVKATFTITSATHTPTMSAFTVNWNEGAVVRSFGTVDLDHRLMWAVGETGSAVTNATYIYDQRFPAWLKYSIPFQAPARVDGSIYFGGASVGTVYNWPSGTNDNGSAITGFWKSKDFIVPDPFIEKDFISYGITAKAQAASNIDFIYTINTSSSITVNHLLTADVSGASLRRVNSHFPSGKYGTFINIRFGNDDSDSPFEVYTLKYDYRPRAWRVIQ